MRHSVWLAISIVTAACGGDDPAPAQVDSMAPDALEPAPDAAIDAAPATRIEVTIDYAGSAEGALLAAAFTSFPPEGPPGAFAQEATPTFPVTLVLEGLEPRTYHVLGFLDVAPASPTQPGPEDLTAWSDPIELGEHQTGTVALTLEEPR